MTLHASKGLEFPVVYLVAVEEGLLPHERSRGVLEQLEEERRLMFVGITRARERLQISRSEYRDFRGERKLTVPSSFLMELPREEMDLLQPGGERRVEIEFQPPDDEPIHRHDEPIETTPKPAAKVETTLAISRAVTSGLRTAAELAGQEPSSPPVDPNTFRHGMVVRHPDFGLGKVAALSGTGTERSATVDFASIAGRKKITLLGSKLRPVK